MRKHVVPWTFSAALFGSLLVLCAVASADDLERTLNQTYRGKVFVLRNFWRGDLLRYDSAGQIIGNATSGFWTTDGLVRVEEVRLTGDTLNLECKRMFMVESKDGFDYRERSKKARKREIAIDLGPKPISAETAGAVLSKILVSGKADFFSEMPDYWKPCVKTALQVETHEPGLPLYPLRNGCKFGSRMLTALSLSSSELGTETDAGVTPSNNGQDKVILQPPNSGAKRGGGVSAPKVISAPDPEYSVEGREAGFSGTGVFSLFVDNAGIPKQIEVVRPLGYGLDEIGVATLQTWRFEPARKDGQPVSVSINVEMQFRLQ